VNGVAAATAAACGRQAVDFVEENDRGLPALRLLEQQPQGALCLAHVFTQTVCAPPIEEGDWAWSFGCGAQ
jgi:hypothetical protein